MCRVRRTVPTNRGAGGRGKRGRSGWGNSLEKDRVGEALGAGSNEEKRPRSTGTQRRAGARPSARGGKATTGAHRERVSTAARRKLVDGVDASRVSTGDEARGSIAAANSSMLDFDVQPDEGRMRIETGDELKPLQNARLQLHEDQTALDVKRAIIDQILPGMSPLPEIQHKCPQPGYWRADADARGNRRVAVGHRSTHSFGHFGRAGKAASPQSRALNTARAAAFCIFSLERGADSFALLARLAGCISQICTQLPLGHGPVHPSILPPP